MYIKILSSNFSHLFSDVSSNCLWTGLLAVAKKKMEDQSVEDH